MSKPPECFGPPKLKARPRPTMDDWRKARAFDWLAEHGDSVYPISDTEWVVFLPDGQESVPLDLLEAIRVARALQGET